MKVGLIDIDNKIPNLALMKIKSFYKNKADWIFYFDKYDIVYISKIFKFTNDISDNRIHANKIIKGGTGYDVRIKLPLEIDNCQPDYAIYPKCNFSLQRYTIGCVRNCSFCIVREKEGLLQDVDPMNENINGEYIYLLDNNFFASKNWRENIKHLQNYKKPVQFEGIDIRLLTEEMIIELNKIKPYKQFHFAWDDIIINIEEKLKLITKIIKSYKLMCYVLIGFNTNHDENYYRVMKLREYGISPFVMPYNKQDFYQKSFARWVNHKAIFKSVEWGDYKTYFKQQGHIKDYL